MDGLQCEATRTAPSHSGTAAALWWWWAILVVAGAQFFKSKHKVHDAGVMCGSFVEIGLELGSVA